MRIIGIRLSCSILLICSANGQTMSDSITRWDSSVDRVLQDSEAVTVWVFLKDKKLHTNTELNAAIARVGATYNLRATQRRKQRRTIPGNFDERDIPVAAEYVRAVLRSGATLRIESRWLNAVSVIADSSQLKAINRLPFVESIRAVRNMSHLPTTINETDLQAPYATAGSFHGLSESQLAQINVTTLHAQGFTGEGIVIGVLDTGFRKSHEAFNHPDKPLKIVAEWDFVNNDPNTGLEIGDPPLQHNHGTLVLGTMAAYMPNELVGAAYDASYILCKVEDGPNEFNGEEDFFVAGLEFIEANGGDVATSSVVINVGYTGDDLDGQTTVMTIAINVATENGIHVCQGVGNSGHDANPATATLVPPSDAFDALTCGAVDSAGNIAVFSSDGPTVDGRLKPEVLTRGVGVWTTDPSSDSGFASVNGTSFSTPQLCGAVACLLQAQPFLDVQQMRDALFTTADYYVANQTHDPTFVRGFGLIDISAAMKTHNIPAVSTWGITIQILLLLITATVILRRSL